ncbi:Uncharacterised protein [Clostridioides difficile]|nr:Uncharacterised protein [Clostridioides difficile]
MAELPGAPESNAGDEFHVLWAVGRALNMLNQRNNLTLIVMEGLSPIDEVTSSKHLLLGADLTEYHGGNTFDSADSVIVSQLKHSHRKPNQTWTASRLAQKGSRGQDGVIARLSDLFRHFRSIAEREQVLSKLSIRLVSNQPISSSLETLLAKVSATLDQSPARPRMTTLQRGLSKKEIADLEKIKAATRLNTSEFGDFLRVLSLDELGADPRWMQWDQIVATIGKHVLIGPSVGARALYDLVRRQALPEADPLRLTPEQILAELGASRHSSLFPLPPRLKMPQLVIPTPDADRITTAILSGIQHVVAHGDAGVGKTTTVALLENSLPTGSAVISYDCFGNGEYLSPTESRHLARPALTQIINEIAFRYGTPILIPGNEDEFSIWQHLRDILAAASTGLEAHDGHLVIAIDAADNAAIAGRHRGHSVFLQDLWLVPLPPKVHIVATCRTHRRTSISAPESAREIELSGFDLDASAIHLRTRFPSATDTQCRRFHERTTGNARSQFYVLDSDRPDAPTTVGDAITRSDITPQQIFDDLLSAATMESQDPATSELLLANLISLSRPASIETLAGASGLEISDAESFCHGLIPGVVVEGHTVSFRDEDFEAHLRDKVSSEACTAAHARLASYFMSRRTSDTLAAISCAEHLYLAGRPNDLIRLAVDEGQPEIVLDPVARLQSYFRRLELGMKVANQPHQRIDVVKLTILAASASTSNNAVTTIVRKRPDLAITYGDATAVARIYEGSHSDPWRGSLHMRLASLRARAGDAEGAIEELRLSDAWIHRWSRLDQHERHDWVLGAEDVAAGAEAIFILYGAEAASDEIRRWQPFDFAMECATKLVESLSSIVPAYDLTCIISELAIPAPTKAQLLAALFVRGAVGATESIRLVAEASLTNPADPERRHEPWVASFAELIASSTRDTNLLLRWIAVYSPIFPSHAPNEWTGLDDWGPVVRVRCLTAVAESRSIDVSEFVPPRMRDNEDDSPRDREEKDEQRRRLQTVVSVSLDVLLARATVWLLDVPISDASKPVLERIATLRSRPLHNDSPDTTKQWAVHAVDVLAGAIGDATETATKLMDEIWARDAGLGMHLSPALAGRLIIHEKYRSTALSWLDRAAQATASSVEPATARADRLLDLADIADEHAPDMAAGYYRAAVQAAEGLDDEGAGVLRFHAAVSQGSYDLSDSRTPGIAERLARALERFQPFVSDPERLPWRETAHAVAQLHPPAGLALLSRWEQQDLLPLWVSLPSVLSTVANTFISPQKVLPLLLLSGEDHFPLLIALDIVDSIRIGHNRRMLASALRWLVSYICRDIAPGDRVDAAPAVVEWAKKHGLQDTEPIQRLVVLVDYSKDFPHEHQVPHHHSDDSNSAKVRAVVDKASACPIGDLKSAMDELGEAWARGNDIESFLTNMAASIVPADRTRLLRAISDIPAGHRIWRFHTRSLFATIHTLLNQWNLMPAVNSWATDELPFLIRAHVQDIVAYEQTADMTLPIIASMPGLSDATGIIIEGIGPLLSELSATQLYSIAQGVAITLPTDDRLNVLDWSLAQLEEAPVRTPSISLDPIDVLSRFLYSLFGHPDKHVRWRAAHSARQILSDDPTDLPQLWSRFKEQSAGPFGPDTGTFFALSAQSWLLMLIDRMAADRPSTVESLTRELAEIALDQSFPHAAHRELARRAALSVFEFLGPGDQSTSLIEDLNLANKPQSSRLERRIGGRGGAFDNRDNRRFRFNSLDTVPYWFGPLANQFGISCDNVCDRAERWIVDNLLFTDESVSTEPALLTQRYRYTEFRNDHGELPQVEDLQTYLEYHAMMLVAGELVDLGTSVVVPTWDDPDDPWEVWISDHVPSPTGWMIEKRAPAPVTPASFGVVPSIDRWRDRNPSDFDHELGLDTSTAAIVVDSYCEVFASKRHGSTWVASALVSPSNAAALLVALQICSDPTDFRLPPEDFAWSNQFEVNDGQFQLRGWVQEKQRHNLGPEKHDPLRRIDDTFSRPGTLFTETLNLKSLNMGRDLVNTDGNLSAWNSQWSDLPTSTSNSGHTTTTQGRQTWVRLDELLTFMEQIGMDVIFEVRIARQFDGRISTNDGGDGNYEPGESRIYLLRRGGKLETLDGSRELGENYR